VSAEDYGAGIGVQVSSTVGNVTISNLMVTATGKSWTAGIGGATDSTIGDVTISKSTVTVTDGFGNAELEVEAGFPRLRLSQSRTRQLQQLGRMTVLKLEVDTPPPLEV
jgi:hypothetical protein